MPAFQAEPTLHKNEIMDDTAEQTLPTAEKTAVPAEEQPFCFYRIQFRTDEQLMTASARINNLQKNEVVMVQTVHGPEPAVTVNRAPKWPEDSAVEQKAGLSISRRATRDEIGKYERLADMESKAFTLCADYIKRFGLPMHLVKVERFFSGSKIIFYFTAESRVDFRELVKTLVQEFRTRVEMRQIGVRHETMMLGGLGACGRELCCSSFIKNFESVSIKMAKAQNLPLNPAKISGTCNRLLCCLNYEFQTYKALRKEMPKQGKYIKIDDQTYKVLRHNVLQESILVAGSDGSEITLSKEEWLPAKPVSLQVKKTK